MASVTFPTSLGGSGITVSDDANPNTGLANGGHRTRFVPALQGAVAMAGYTAQYAAKIDQAASDADRAENARGYVEAVAEAYEVNILEPFKQQATLVSDFATHNFRLYDGQRINRVADTDIWTIQRTSTGSYLDAAGNLRTASIGEPRYTYDPRTGAESGLLMEDARQNFLLHSEDWTAGSFGNGWRTGSTYFASLVDSDHPQRPDVPVTYYGPNSGVQSFVNACTQQVLPSLSGPGDYFINQDFKAIGDTTHVRFLPLAADGDGLDTIGGVLSLTGAGGVLTENFTPGGAFESQELGSYPLGNGWYRCWIKFKTTRLITQFRATRAFPYVGSSALVGDGVSGLQGTMAQLIIGQSETSYIPTSTSTVTRARDFISVPDVSHLIPRRGFTAYAEFYQYPYENIPSFPFTIGTNVDNYIGPYVNSGGAGSSTFAAYNGQSFAFSHTAIALQFNQRVRVAVSVDNDGVITTAVNGQSVTFNAGGFQLPANAKLQLNERFFGFVAPRVEYRDVFLLPQFTAAAALEALTAI